MRLLSRWQEEEPLCQPSCSYTFELESNTCSLVSTGKQLRQERQKLRQLFASLSSAALCNLGLLDGRHRKRKKCKGNSEQFIPTSVGVVQDGRAKRYAWNGHCLQAVEPDVLLNGETGMGNLRAKLRHLKHTITDAFFPHRDAVTPDYWQYVWWRAGHRLSSSMLNNFATQSLLAAVGVGAQNQLPAAATINWLLKDGLGRLGRLSVAASFGQSFDSDLKRFRWLTSLIFSSSIALEYLTPLLPRHFLLLASLSNVGKSVGVTTYVATHPAFMRSFARGENLADINAKGQAQQMVMDTLGLALCVGLTFAVRNNPRGRMLLPLCAFPVLAASDLICIFRELKATHLRTLNRERAEMVAERWLADGTVFTAEEVSSQEKLLLPSQVGAGRYPLHFAPLEEAVESPDKLTTLLERHRGQSFLLSYLHQPYCSPYLGSREAQGHLAVTLEEGAHPHQILSAVLQAAIFRRLLNAPEPAAEVPSRTLASRPRQTASDDLLADGHSKFTSWDWAIFRRMLDAAQTELVSHENAQTRTDPRLAPKAGVNGVRWRWPEVDAETGARTMAVSADLAKIAAPHFVHDLQQGEWQTQPFMISAHEKSGFVLLPAD